MGNRFWLDGVGLATGLYDSINSDGALVGTPGNNIPVTITFDTGSSSGSDEEQQAAIVAANVISSLNNSPTAVGLLNAYGLEGLTVNIGGTNNIGMNLTGVGFVNINLDEVERVQYTTVDGQTAEMTLEHAVIHELVHAITNLSDYNPLHNQLTNEILVEMSIADPRRSYGDAWFTDECFLAGTMIDMWPLDPSIKPGPNGKYNKEEVLAKVWQKPIEDITPQRFGFVLR